MTPSDYDFLRSFLKERSGLVLSNDKQYLIESRLLPVARQAGLDTLTALVARLKTAAGAALGERVVDAMTTNESFFFRDKTPFEHFEQVMLPQLMEARKAERKIRIWCAAASTGQEPYSLAMVLKEMGLKASAYRFDILGTDISRDVLDRAKQVQPGPISQSSGEVGGSAASAKITTVRREARARSAMRSVRSAALSPSTRWTLGPHRAGTCGRWRATSAAVTAATAEGQRRTKRRRSARVTVTTVSRSGQPGSWQASSAMAMWSRSSRDMRAATQPFSRATACGSGRGRREKRPSISPTPEVPRGRHPVHPPPRASRSPASRPRG